MCCRCGRRQLQHNGPTLDGAVNIFLPHNVEKHTFWHTMRPTTAQINLCIRAVWSVCSLCAWRNFASLATQTAPSEDSDQTARLRRLILTFAGAHVRRCVFWRCDLSTNHVLSDLQVFFSRSPSLILWLNVSFCFVLFCLFVCLFFIFIVCCYSLLFFLSENIPKKLRHIMKPSLCCLRDIFLYY